MMRTLFLCLFLAVSTMALGQRKMKYSAAKQEFMYTKLTKNEKVMTAVQKLPKGNQKKFLNKMAIFMALSSEDQKHVSEICFECLSLQKAKIETEEPNYTSRGWIADAVTAVGAVLGMESGPVGVAVGAAIGKAVGSMIEAAIEEYKDALDEVKQESQSVMAGPNGEDCTTNGRTGFPFN